MVVRLRNVKAVREKVLTRGGRYRGVESGSEKKSPLKVKEVLPDDRRYIVCLNEVQARKDAADRQMIIESLRSKLKQGDKSLVGNKGYRKYLKSADKAHFSIDREKVQQEARYDGRWVLTTDTDMAADEVAAQYKMLWMVETIYRTMKSTIDTRPIFHKVDDTIRGHVFCSFLAILLRSELERRLEIRGYDFEWNDVLRDLESVEEVTARISDKTVVFRSEMRGCAAQVFQASGVAIPPAMHFAE